MDTHPIDFSALQRGIWLEAEAIEKAMNVRRGTDGFRLATLKLAGMIESQTDIVCRSEGDRLRLMTDAELLEWNWEQHRAAARKMARCASRVVLVRHSELSDAELRRARYQETTITFQAAQTTRQLRDVRRTMAAGSEPPKWLTSGGDQ